jgi:peptidoglycan-N-acetylglucosamine deacetylase
VRIGSIVSDRRVSVCLSFNFETVSAWPSRFGLGSSTMRSRGEFGAFAMPRILALLNRHSIEATFFVPDLSAGAYPELVRSIAGSGHEVGYLDCLDGAPGSGGFERQRRQFTRGLDRVSELTGARPVGFRSQCNELSDDGIGLLLDTGFVYEASHGATDFYPYYLRRGDVWSPTAPYVFGDVSELVAMPFSYGLNDFPHFEFVPGWATNLMAPSSVEEIWRAEFDSAYEGCRDGVYVLTLDPQVIGRGSRLAMLDRLVVHFKSRPAVGFVSMGRFVDRWKEEHPRSEWVASNPVLAGTGALRERRPTWSVT